MGCDVGGFFRGSAGYRCF